MFSDRFDQLVQALRILPSVGSKSAQRMALHLIMKNRQGAVGLAHALNEATSYIHECRLCHSLTENEICDICLSHERDDQLLCVVESPADVMAIEQSGSFKGKYHVLGGLLSALDGVGPDQIRPQPVGVHEPPPQKGVIPPHIVPMGPEPAPAGRKIVSRHGPQIATGRHTVTRLEMYRISYIFSSWTS